ncbi:MAG: hypothetical protein K2X87_31200 [Gemmataceae bacterium]|nr:hypothetical protein [Gemmataceae bacterium]
MPRRITLEVAVTTPDEAVAAVAAGADRLELCAALEVGGVTPSVGLDFQVRQAVGCPVVILIRPRPGGFVYSAGEIEAMREEVLIWQDREREPVKFVLGVLGWGDGRPVLDRDRCRELAQTAEWRVAFHRAFDFLPDLPAALEDLIDLGFKRVLTSGGKPTALEGADVIAKLIERARGRIEILPGGGITPENVEELVRRTGCDQVHGSFRSPVTDPTLAANPALAAGMGGGTALDPARVAATRAVLDRLAGS